MFVLKGRINIADFRAVNVTLLTGRITHELWTWKEVNSRITNNPPDIFILCHTLSEEECINTLSTTHSIRPDVKTLVVVRDRTGCAAGAQDEILIAADSNLTIGPCW